MYKDKRFASFWLTLLKGENEEEEEEEEKIEEEIEEEKKKEKKKMMMMLIFYDHVYVLDDKAGFANYDDKKKE